MNKVKKTTLTDRIKNAWRAFCGKPASSLSLGIDVKRCDECDRDAIESALDNSTKEFLKLHDEYQNAKTELVNTKAIIDELLETLQSAIDTEERHKQTAWNWQNLIVYSMHLYTAKTLIDLKAELKKKYEQAYSVTEDKNK